MPRLHGDPPPYVGEGEVVFAVPAISRSYQIKKGLVLRNRQQLTLAEHPTGGREVSGEHPYFTNIWLCHQFSPLSLRGEDALQRDTKVQNKKGLHVQMGLAAAYIGDRAGLQSNEIV